MLCRVDKSEDKNRLSSSRRFRSISSRDRMDEEPKKEQNSFEVLLIVRNFVIIR